jgi:hypothetical protein
MLFLFDNLIDSATVTASSAATGFPATNLQNPFRSKVWRTSGATAGLAQLVINHGSAKAVNAIALCGYSWTTAPGRLVMEFNSTDSWDTPAATETLTWNAPTTPGGNKGSIILKLSTTRTYQYNRLRVVSGNVVLSAAVTAPISITPVNPVSGAWLNAYATAFDTFASSSSAAFTASDASGETGIRVMIDGMFTQGKEYSIYFYPTFSGATLNNIWLSTVAYGGVQAIDLAPGLVSGTRYFTTFRCNVTTAVGIMFTLNVDAGGSFAIAVFACSENNGTDVGTKNFTLVWGGSLPDYTPTVLKSVLAKRQGAVTYCGYRFDIAKTGKPSLVMYRNNAGTTFTATVAPAITDGAEHEFAAVVTRETAAAAGSVVFYVDGVALGNPVAITAAAAISISNSQIYAISGTSTTGTPSTTKRAIVYSRALLAAEILALYGADSVDSSDESGSPVSRATGAWLNAYATAFDTFASTAGGAFTASDAGGETGIRIIVPLTSDTVSGKRYRISFIPTFSGVTMTAIRLSDSSYTGAQSIAASPALTSGTEYSVEFTATEARSHVVFIFTVNAGGSFAVMGFTFVQTGAMIDLEPEGITPTDWQDASSNNLNATYPVSACTTNAADFDLGRLFVGEYFEPAREYSWGYEEEVVDPSLISQTIGGQDHADEIERYRIVRASGILETQAQWVLYQAMINTVGRRKPLFVAFDYTNDAAERTIYGKFTNLPKVTRPFLYYYDFEITEDR